VRGVRMEVSCDKEGACTMCNVNISVIERKTKFLKAKAER
jgi:ferredoxin